MDPPFISGNICSPHPGLWQVLPRPTPPKQAFHRQSNRSDTDTLSEGDESEDVGSGLDDELPFLSPQTNVRSCCAH